MVTNTLTLESLSNKAGWFILALLSIIECFTYLFNIVPINNNGIPSKSFKSLLVSLNIMLKCSWLTLPKPVDINNSNKVVQFVVASKGGCLPDTSLSSFTITSYAIGTVAGDSGLQEK